MIVAVDTYQWGMQYLIATQTRYFILIHSLGRVYLGQAARSVSMSTTIGLCLSMSVSDRILGSMYDFKQE